MQIELNVPDKVVRKIRALNILMGGQTADFESIIANILERSVDAAILEYVDSPLVSKFTAPSGPPIPAHRATKSRAVEDTTGLSDGLGDFDEGEPSPPKPVSDMEASIPERGGLTDKDLERDGDVEDPDHEAKAEASTFADELSGGSAEAQFAQVAGLPIPVVAEDGEVDHRIAKRKKRAQIPSGRVSLFTGSESSESGGVTL